MRLRSILIIPAGGELDEALASEADAIAVTLADAGHRVEDLRQGAAFALPRIRERGKKALVVVNHPRTQLLRSDLEAVVSTNLDAVLMPHTVEPQDVRDLAVGLREFEYDRDIEPGTVRAFPVIDTARGLLRAPEIAQAVPRIAGLVFGSRGYAEDVGARHEEAGARLSYARGAVVAAARAFDGLPLLESEGLELTQAAQQGFAGVLLTNPRYAQQANAVFTPSAAQRDRARARLEAYEHRGEGAWVARYGEGVVDAQSARKARQLLEE
ncbi:MAG: aldolase/citrate lyase family protein [Hyphomicrobiales bacterium]